MSMRSRGGKSRKGGIMSGIVPLGSCAYYQFNAMSLSCYLSPGSLASVQSWNWLCLDGLGLIENYSLRRVCSDPARCAQEPCCSISRDTDRTRARVRPCRSPQRGSFCSARSRLHSTRRPTAPAIGSWMGQGHLRTVQLVGFAMSRIPPER